MRPASVLGFVRSLATRVLGAVFSVEHKTMSTLSLPPRELNRPVKETIPWKIKTQHAERLPGGRNRMQGCGEMAFAWYRELIINQRYPQ